MKKLWSIAILLSVVFAQLPQPTLVGQDDLKVPTLSINNFVNQAEIEGLEDSRVFLGITNILTENVMDSRYDLVEQDSDFEMTARVVYLGKPRTSTTILGLFRRETTTTEVRVVVEIKNKKTGKVVSGQEAAHLIARGNREGRVPDKVDARATQKIEHIRVFSAKERHCAATTARCLKPENVHSPPRFKDSRKHAPRSDGQSCNCPPCSSAIL